MDHRSIKVENRLLRDKPYKTYYICLANSVDVEILGSRHQVWDDSFYYNNIILCEMRLYSDGLLEMVPGFSGISKEPYVSGSSNAHSDGKGKSSVSGSDATVDAITHTEPANSSIFMNNQTIIAGFKGGFRMETYTVRTDEGHIYEYSLQNMNAIPVVDSAIDYGLLSRPLLSALAPETNKETVGSVGDEIVIPKNAADMTKWKQDPPCMSSDYTCTIYGEIMQAVGFEGQKLMVNYEVLVPNGDTKWTLRKGMTV